MRIDAINLWWVKVVCTIVLVHILSPLSHGWVVSWIIAPLVLAVLRERGLTLVIITCSAAFLAAWTVGAPLWEWLLPLVCGVGAATWIVRHWAIHAWWQQGVLLFFLCASVWIMLACAHQHALTPLVQHVTWMRALQHASVDAGLALLLIPLFARRHPLRVASV